ncbi:MAG: endolytic transglycosylase MltG [Acidobacteriota bacterium]
MKQASSQTNRRSAADGREAGMDAAQAHAIEARRRHFTFRPRWFALVWMAMAAALAASAGLLWAVRALSSPYPHPFQEEILVDIPPGASLGQIAQKLQAQGVVRSALLFRWYSAAFSLSTRLQAGEYLFDHPMSLVEVTEKLHRGDIHYRKLVIREGLDLGEIVQHLESQGWGSSDRFEELARDPSPIAGLDPQAEDLEGYLFPDTYHLTRDMNEFQVVSLMLERFRSSWSEERRRRAQELGMSLRQVLTLASLIEKETSLAAERPLVSSVFHNRLQRNMKLACDPTVIYAVKRVKPYDGILHRSDLQLDSPYNTYLYPGLPPGPISNAGLQSIAAALYPADTDYLYFVSRNDGSHVFSRTYRQHARAVQEFQR